MIFLTLICISLECDAMVIKVIRKDGESGEKLLRRFNNHIKSTRIQKKMRKLRNFSQKPTKQVARASAIAREGYRSENKRKQFLSS